MSDPVTLRVAELARTHTLSPARREGAELALRDAAARGEWPARVAPPVGNAAQVVEALRSLGLDVTGEVDLAIQRALR